MASRDMNAPRSASSRAARIAARFSSRPRSSASIASTASQDAERRSRLASSLRLLLRFASIRTLSRSVATPHLSSKCMTMSDSVRHRDRSVHRTISISSKRAGGIARLGTAAGYPAWPGVRQCTNIETGSASEGRSPRIRLPRPAPGTSPAREPAAPADAVRVDHVPECCSGGSPPGAPYPSHRVRVPGRPSMSRRENASFPSRPILRQWTSSGSRSYVLDGLSEFRKGPDAKRRILSSSFDRHRYSALPPTWSSRWPIGTLRSDSSVTSTSISRSMTVGSTRSLARMLSCFYNACIECNAGFWSWPC